MTFVAMQLAIIGSAVAMLLVFMQVVRRLAGRFGWSAELQRKAVHVVTGLFAVSLPFLFSETWPVFLLIAVTIAVMVVLRHPALAREGVGAAIHGVERKSYGDILFALSVGFLFFRARGDAILYVLPLAVLTLSDTAAALAGSRYGRRHFTIEDGSKSVEGVAMFFLVTWIIAMVALLLLTDIPRVTVVLLGLVIAAFGALVEADSWRGLDNLFLPIGLHLYLEAYLHQSPLVIAAVAAAFLLLLLFLVLFASTLGLNAHSARAYAVAMFLICCYTAPQNAVLPALAVLTHLWARTRVPDSASHSDLESIASLATVSLAWLAAGEWFGRTAINFYTLTFAGVIIALVATGLQTATPGRRRLLGTAALVAVACLFWIVLSSGPVDALWHGNLAWALTATLLLPVVLLAAWPAIFSRYRSARIALVAAAVPAASYAIHLTRGAVS